MQVQPAGFALTGTLDVAVDTGAGTLTVSASDVTLTVGSIGGPTVRGDLTISRALASDGKVVLDVTIANASLTSVPGFSLTHGAGTLRVVTKTGGGTTYAGTLGGTVAVAVGGLTLDGTLGVSFDTAPTVATLSFSGTGLTVSVYGQTFTGDVSVVRNGTGTSVTVSGASLSLAGGLVDDHRTAPPPSLSPPPAR